MVISIVMKSLSDSVHNDAYVGIQVPRVGKKFTSKDLSDGLGLAVNSTEAETFISGEECGHINGGDDMSGGDNSDGYEKQSDYNGAEEEFLRAQDYNVETFMDDFLLDSIAVQFHGDIFLVQFGCHVLFPLAYFLINYKAQGFQITYDALIQSSTYFNLVFPMIVYASIITYFLCPLEDELPVRGAFIVPLIFFLQHRMTVGLKYASLSTTEYEKFQNEQDPQRSETFLLQMQLLGGWASRDPLLLQFELGCAAARIGAKINEISITIRDPTASAAALNEFANWNAFLQRQPTVKLSDKPASELIQHDDGSYSLSVYDLTKAIIRKADVSSHQRLKRLIFVFVGTMALVPWVNILFCCGPMNIFMYRSVYLYIFLTTSSLATSIYGVVCFLLLYVAVWDVSRQLHMVRYLHRLIRITDLTLDTDISFRKAQDSQRSREHLREKVGVILSVSKPERRKTIAIKNSLSAKSTGFSERGGGFHGPQSSDTEGTGMSTSTSSGRRVSAKDIKQRFVDFGTKSVKDEDRSHIPQISFKCPENVIGWTYSRLVFQHFGERFRTRIDTYTGMSTLHCIAMRTPAHFIVHTFIR